MIKLGLFYTFLAIEVCFVDCGCRDKDFDKLKNDCKRSGLNFDMAETIQNKTLVCECLQELFDCVNRTVPNCVDSMKDKYITFRYTPWDCHLLEDASTEIGNKCGNDVIFEVRIKESTDNIIIFQTDVNNYIEKSANSCRISYGAAMIYLMLMVKCVLLWCNQ
ncbi:uncharacterized protein LOC132740910 isoform X1 [Ruditapes philippinarum]|uniref:uncharacterized protein LOC132740910 isoform X1 n=1 Tax=Ruditapes philippinarum TaxID=129788 RepID=UPI00295A98EE|nr:uncharacterized protein LOC132740910 isoform X1 [Ruditapes philippinarum]